jgi:hypothetical protein
LASADKDRDGALTQADVQEALRHLVTSTHTEEAAAEIIRKLDSDRDGAVTVEALEAFLDGYAARLAKQAEEAADRSPAGALTGSKTGSKATQSKDRSVGESEGSDQELEHVSTPSKPSGVAPTKR